MGPFIGIRKGKSLAYLKWIEKRNIDIYQTARSSILAYISTKVTIKGSAFWVNLLKKKNNGNPIRKIDNNLPKRSKYIVDN